MDCEYYDELAKQELKLMERRYRLEETYRELTGRWLVADALMVHARQCMEQYGNWLGKAAIAFRHWRNHFDYAEIRHDRYVQTWLELADQIDDCRRDMRHERF